MSTPTDDNPFAPPTPSLSREPGARVVSDENPFESALESVPLHAPLDGVSSMPPDAAAVAARERELARREARLAEEERDISAREADARARATDPASRSKNFPGCFPLLRHDLDDFAPSNRPLMRAAHYAWLLTACAYVWNALVMTAAALVGVNETGAGDWILAVAFAGFGVPASRYFWHAPLVAATGKNVQPRSLAQTAAFGRFFLHFIVHLCVSTIFLLAVPFIGTFAAGLFFVVAALAGGGDENDSSKRFVGALGVLNVLAWSAALAASAATGRLALRRFRE
jgi:hypothetical protein